MTHLPWATWSSEISLFPAWSMVLGFHADLRQAYEVQKPFLRALENKTNRWTNRLRIDRSILDGWMETDRHTIHIGGRLKIRHGR